LKAGAYSVLYLGIDPGKSGALALLDESGSVVDASPMPETQRDVVDYLSEFAPQIRVAHVEAVHAMPNQGVTGMFNFGMSYGGLTMALTCLRIRFELIQPRAWQNTLGIPVVIRKGKNRSAAGREKKRLTRERAQQLFPNHKWTHETADAVLVAEHARRVHTGLKASA